jgi:hypothetical protein
LPPSKSLLRSSSPAERRSSIYPSIYPAGLAAVFSQPGHFHIVNEWRWLRGLRTLHRIIRRATWWGGGGGSPPHLISLAPVAASSSLPSKS